MMASSKRKQFDWFVREVCARLNAPWHGVGEEWFYQSGSNPMDPNRTDAYLQGRQQQLRDHIWCGLPVRALEVRSEETIQQHENLEILVKYRIRDAADGSYVEFLVSPLPVGQIAVYFASRASSDAADLKKLTRGERGKCFLDPTHWVNRLSALSWHHLYPCIHSPLATTSIELSAEGIKPGPGAHEAHHIKFKMPCDCTFTEGFINNNAEEIGPLMNVLRNVEDVATLYLGVGDGMVGTRGIVLGASTGVNNSIPEHVWRLPRIFPPLLRQEVAAEALILERPPPPEIVVAVTGDKEIQNAIIETNGRCWVVRERISAESVVGLVFPEHIPQKYATTRTFVFNEDIHSIEDRYVIRIRITPSEEARVGTHLLLQRMGVIYRPSFLFPDETSSGFAQLDALSAWLRLQTVQPALQAWFVNDTNLKVVVTPSHIPASKLLHCPLSTAFCEVKGNKDDYDSLQTVLSNRTVASRFVMVHADMWSTALTGVIHQDIKLYQTTWNAVLLVPLTIELAELKRIVRGMVAEDVKILAVLPVGLRQRLFLTNLSKWKNEWAQHDIAVPVLYDASVCDEHLRMVFKSWIFPEDTSVERGPPSWELVAKDYVIQTTAARCLLEAVNWGLTKSSNRIHFYKVVPDSKFPTCGKTCVLRRVAWDLDKHYVVLWMAKPKDFTPDFVNGIQRAMQQSQKAVILFCDFECGEDWRKAFSKSFASLEQSIVLVFSGEASPTTSSVLEITVNPIWEFPELEALGKNLAGASLSHAVETQRALDEALKYSREDSSTHVNRHFFILVLAAARGHFVPAWEWVKQARKQTERLGDALAFLRVMTDREDQWKIPVNDPEQPCDLWVACQPPHRHDRRRWFAFAHPFLACLHLHLSEAGDHPPHNRDLSLIDDLPSPNALSKLWETTTEIISGRLVDTKVLSIAQDVLQTRRTGRSFSRFSEAFLADPSAFIPCVNLPRNNRLRLQEPHASMLVSRVFREAGWFTDAWIFADHAQQICPNKDAALLALTRNNRAMVVAKHAVQLGAFQPALWAWNEFNDMLMACESTCTTYDYKKAKELTEQIARIKGQMKHLASYFPGLTSNDTEEEFIYGRASTDSHWEHNCH